MAVVAVVGMPVAVSAGALLAAHVEASVVAGVAGVAANRAWQLAMSKPIHAELV